MQNMVAEEVGIQSNLEQYQLQDRVIDNVVCDFTRHPWRDIEFLDAIVCDPPYGVRAGAKKISSKSSPPFYNGDAFKQSGEMRYPVTEPYEMEDILIDLIEFAAQFLRFGGRLVFWLPTARDTYKPDDIPSHPLLHLIANSEQNFGKWARRLITMEKVALDKQGVPHQLKSSQGGHVQFRKRYFERFA